MTSDGASSSLQPRHLVKGARGGDQNLNLMFGAPETEGLEEFALFP